MKTIKRTTQILGEITISVDYHGFGWTATEAEYDGPEDTIRINHSFKSEADAVNGLIEKMEEHELERQHDDRPSDEDENTWLSEDDPQRYK